MMRINLLPPEILERRRSEKNIGYAVLVAILVAVVLAAVWAFAFMRVEAKRRELAEIQQQVKSTQAQADQLAIFEQRALELNARRTIVTTALGDRRDWAKLLTEISLVLPSDVWVQTLSASETEGMQMTGYALDSADLGHKPIAKVLVRLSDLDQLFDVWLTSSGEATYNEEPAIQFGVTASVKVPAVEGATP